MKKLKPLFILFLALVAFACGGGGEQTAQDESTKENNNSESDTENSEEAQAKPESMCFVSEDGLTKLYLNLNVAGNDVSGTADYVTPKAGFTIFSSYTIEGNKDNSTLNLTFTAVDATDGVEVGSSYEEIWRLDEELIVVEGEDALIPSATRVKCNPADDEERKAMLEDAKEYGANDPTAPQELFTYEGTIDGKLKIKMFLATKEAYEDGGIPVEGYYYYESQGPDKTIDLEGTMVDMADVPSFLVEIADGKEYGRFAIEPGYTLGDVIDCIWVSADGKKELEVVLNPVEE